MTIKKYLTLVKKFRYDILIIAFFFGTAYFMQQKPDLRSLNVEYSQKFAQKKLKTQTIAKPNAIETYEYLEKRNIFALDGKYPEIKNNQKIPENPYKLIGIFNTQPRDAILLDYLGNTESVKIGTKLIDGSIVRYIGTTSVTIQKPSGEYKRLKLFQVDKKYFQIKSINAKKYIKEQK